MRRAFSWWIAFVASTLSLVGGLLPTPNNERPAARREGRAEHQHVPDEIFQEPPAAVAFAQVATPTAVPFFDYLSPDSGPSPLRHKNL